MNQLKARCLGLSFVVCALHFLAHPSARAQSANRGVWFWNTPSGPLGSANIVGSSTLENQAVREFQRWGIAHVYGSYGSQPATNPATVGQWNQMLSGHGIESALLLAQDTWTFDDSGLLEDLQTQLLNFNDSQPARAQFKAVHLDIEPQGLSTWPTDNQYLDLLDLANTYQDARDFLNTNGAADIPIYADLADWFYSLTAINWPSASARDQWFVTLSHSLAGITLMAYDLPTFSQISGVVQYELTNFAGGVRVGLEADIGPGQTWSNLEAMLGVASQLESNYTDSVGIDLEDFSLLEQAAPPVLEFGLPPLLTTNGFNLMLWGPIGSNYAIQASLDLVNWQTLTNYVSTTWLTDFVDPAASHYPYRFYRVAAP